jgi:hypothetical protein
VKWRCITACSRDDVLSLLKDKYERIEDKVWKDIEVLPHRINHFYRDPLMIDILICATNSALYWFLENGNIQAAKWYIGLADWPNIHPKQNKYYKNHLVLADERVFDYGDQCDWISYRKKILFDRFKQKDYGFFIYDYMLNLSLVERRFPKEWMMDLFDAYGRYHVSFGAYTGHKNKEYYSWLNELEYVYLIKPPVEDFMGLFQNFIYIPYKDGSDATPRLIPECVYYEKECDYYDVGFEDIKSGGYYRWKDTMEDDWMKLWLKQDDELMENIEKCLIK